MERCFLPLSDVIVYFTDVIKTCLGLTGGIATGKSTALRFLSEQVSGIEVFDADMAVQELLSDSSVLNRLVKLFERDILTLDGKLDYKKLRKIVFSCQDERKKLEKFLHPQVRKQCLVKREKWLTKNSSTLFVADVPLLFEVELDFGQDMNLVVATTSSTQRLRLKKRNCFDDEMISSIMAAQLPILEKVERADVVIWNEGPECLLHRQLKIFIDSLNHP